MTMSVELDRAIFSNSSVYIQGVIDIFWIRLEGEKS